MDWISYWMGLWWISVLEHFFSRVGLEGSFNQRNLVTSLSSGCTPTWRNAFSTSATSATLWSLNLKRSPHRSSNMTGPWWRLSFRLWFFFLVFCGGVKHYSKFCCCLLGCQYLAMRNVVFQGVCTIFIWDNFHNSLLHLVLDYSIIFLEMFVISWQSIDLGCQPSHCQFIIVW